VKLNVDSDDTALLRNTVDEFLWAANYVTSHAFEGEYVTTGKTTLHDDTDEAVRDGGTRSDDRLDVPPFSASDAKMTIGKCRPPPNTTKSKPARKHQAALTLATTTSSLRRQTMRVLSHSS